MVACTSFYKVECYIQLVGCTVLCKSTTTGQGHKRPWISYILLCSWMDVYIYMLCIQTFSSLSSSRCLNAGDSLDWLRQVSLLPAPGLPLLPVPIPLHHAGHIPPRLTHGGPSASLPPWPQGGVFTHEPDTPTKGEGLVWRGRGKDQRVVTVSRSIGGWDLLEWAWQPVLVKPSSSGSICLHWRGPLCLWVESQFPTLLPPHSQGTEYKVQSTCTTNVIVARP